MGARLGSPAGEQRLRLALPAALLNRPRGVKIDGALWRESRAWTFPALNASSRAALAAAAACDRAVYVDGAARMRTHLALDLSRREPLNATANATAATDPRWPEQIVTRWCDQRMSGAPASRRGSAGGSEVAHRPRARAVQRSNATVGDRRGDPARRRRSAGWARMVERGAGMVAKLG